MNTKEQFVYGLRVFDGKGYIGTFCPESEDSIYVIAKSENIINPRMTEVYYWPITRRYKANFDDLNIPVSGNLEILKHGEVFFRASYKKYVLVYNEGYYAGISKIVVGEEASRLFNEFNEFYNLYQQKVNEYNELPGKYNIEMRRFYERTGENSGEFDIANIPEKPKVPVPPKTFVQEPTEGIPINLPEGQYEIRMRAPDGSIIEGSEKKLISFNKRRSGNVGYEIIPEDRWTIPEVSSNPEEIFYFKDDNTLYMRPFSQVEYNDLNYAKLLDPQIDGNPEAWRWINIKQLEKYQLRINVEKKDASGLIIKERPYKVRQTTGPQLGYEVLEFDPKTDEGSPSIVGHRLKIDSEYEVYYVTLLDESGKLIPESYREFRRINKEKNHLSLLAAFILPLLCGGPIWLWRKYKH